MNLTTKLSDASLKTADALDGIIEGYASTFGNVDSYNDSIKKGAFAETLAHHEREKTVIPVLFEHDRTLGSHVGEIIEAKEDDNGLYIKARLDMDTEVGTRALNLVKGRRIKGMSIGFYPQEVSSGVIQGKNVNIIEKIDLKEISLVLNPADSHALVTSVKTAVRGNEMFQKAKKILQEREVEEDLDELFKHSPKWLDEFKTSLDRRETLSKGVRASFTSSGRGLSDDDLVLLKANIEEIEELDKRLDSQLDRQLKSREADEIYEELKKAFRGEDTTMNNRLATKANDRLRVAGNIVNSLVSKDSGTSTKGIAVVGDLLAPVPVSNGILPVEREPLALLSAIPTTVASSPAFSYLRQTVRELNAAVVATGAEKPKSNLGFERVDDTLEVVAHIVREVDEYLLRDVEALKSFISSEMIAGVYEQVEQLVVEGIDAASGAQAQAFTTDAFTTARLAKSKLQTKGLAPAFYVLNHDDWALLETTKAEGSGTFLFNSAPVDTTNGTLWGIPVITTSYTPIGTAKLIATESVSLFTDGQVRVAMNTSQTDFEHNQVSFRAEGRFKPVVVRSAGLVGIELAAPVIP